MVDRIAMEEAECKVDTDNQKIKCDIGRRPSQPESEVVIDGEMGTVEIDSETGSGAYFRPGTYLNLTSRGIQGVNPEDEDNLTVQAWP